MTRDRLRDADGRPSRGRRLARRMIVGTAAMTTLAAATVVGGDLLGVVEPRAWVPGATSAPYDPTPVADRDPGDEADRDPGAEAPGDPTDAPEPTPTARPTLDLGPGDEGVRVRELQVRLAQLAWYLELPSGTYDATTRDAVRGFQEKRGLPATGRVDRSTWRRLTSMTEKPTRAELFAEPGETLLALGDEGPQVRDLEARLRQIAWFSGDVDDTYDDATRAAVRGFQGKRRIPATGEVDQRTLDLLAGMTSTPTADELANVRPTPSSGAPLDPRCLSGAVLCIDKSSQSLRWVVDGDVRMDLDVRFGSAELPTREGAFTVYRKSRDHVSSIYHTPMPMAMFFSGGQAVHYSPDFAAHGYAGASHGCVNVRDYGAIASLYDQVPIGTRVIVYWS